VNSSLEREYKAAKGRPMVSFTTLDEIAQLIPQAEVVLKVLMGHTPHPMNDSCVVVATESGVYFFVRGSYVKVFTNGWEFLPYSEITNVVSTKSLLRKFTLIVSTASRELETSFIPEAECNAFAKIVKERLSQPLKVSIRAGVDVSLKPCPDCAEDVKAAAKRCRYCGHDFSQPA
jgi:hypothetical protein